MPAEHAYDWIPYDSYDENDDRMRDACTAVDALSQCRGQRLHDKLCCVNTPCSDSKPGPSPALKSSTSAIFTSPLVSQYL